MTRKQRYKKDMIGEQAATDFTIENIYTAFTTNIQRIYDEDIQKKGLDIIASAVTSTGEIRVITIDEKASLYWRHLHTFAQEVSFINNSDKVQKGWLLDFNSLSDYLLYIWIDETINGVKDIMYKEDILDATVSLVRKRDLWRYLKDNGIDSDRLYVYCNDMRDNNILKNWITPKNKTFKITIQDAEHEERAANILLDRDILSNDLSLFCMRWNKKVSTIITNRL